MLSEMRSERNFYKKVLEEDFREKRPDSYRYKDAEIRVRKLNTNGKYLSTLTK